MAFIKYKVANLAQAPLIAGINNSTVSVSVTSGRGALFPAVPFLAKIEEFDVNNVCIKREIVKVTAKADDLFTIVRSFGYCPASDTAYTQTNTAFAFSAGAILSHTLTAEQLDDIQTEIERIEDDKLNASGELRTWLTAKRVIITDASGNETYLSGTNGQVVGFDADGDPIATTPSVDIDGLTEDTAPDMDADYLVEYDVSASTNKKFKISSVRATDAEVKAGTSTTKFVTPDQIGIVTNVEQVLNTVTHSASGDSQSYSSSTQFVKGALINVWVHRTDTGSYNINRWWFQVSSDNTNWTTVCTYDYGGGNLYRNIPFQVKAGNYIRLFAGGIGSYTVTVDVNMTSQSVI